MAQTIPAARPAWSAPLQPRGTKVPRVNAHTITNHQGKKIPRANPRSAKKIIWSPEMGLAAAIRKFAKLHSPLQPRFAKIARASFRPWTILLRTVHSQAKTDHLRGRLESLSTLSAQRQA